uniref:Uncharacterized protein n=1 Tax=Megaselia scalaris TaxID=36166 RepID=T1GG70_MEGSC
MKQILIILLYSKLIFCKICRTHIENVPEVETRNSSEIIRLRQFFLKEKLASNNNEDFVCCEGYLKINNNCEPICDPNCVQGKCVAPNNCSCDLGFRKDEHDPSVCIPDCKPECIEGQYCSAPNECSWKNESLRTANFRFTYILLVIGLFIIILIFIIISIRKNLVIHKGLITMFILYLVQSKL